MKPDISVIIPVHEGRPFIADAVNSALSQADVNLEVLVADNGSEDETVEMIKGLMKTDERLSYIQALSGSGIAGARNAGVEAASGDWIALLDPNDKWHSDKLFRQSQLIRQYESAGKYPPLCCTGAYVMNDDGSFAGRVIKAPSRISSHDLLTGSVIVASTAMVRRECLLTCPFEQGDLQEDYIEWFRILAQYGAAVGISLPLVRYTLTDRSTSKNKLKSAFATWRTFKFLGLSNRQSLVSFASYLRRGLQI